MAELEEIDPLESLNDRIRDARQMKGEKLNSISPTVNVGAGLSFALRIGVEMVSALVIGVIIGVCLDIWLGTTPWCMILLVLLGSSAGVLNVVRTAKNLDQTVGFRNLSRSELNNHSINMKEKNIGDQ